jgi:hypothetical protein
MLNSYHSDLCPQCRDPWCHGCPTNAEFHAERDVAGRISLPWSSEQGMQQLDTALVPSEAERLSLLEPTPYDAGVCKCGEFVAAGMLHAHRCVSEDEDDCDHTCNCVCPLCLG